MKILNGTGSTSYDDIQIESGVEKILFDAVVDDLAGLATLKVKVENYSKSFGTKPIIPSFPLEDLLEIAAANQGFVRIQTAGTKIRVVGTIELSNAGAIDTREGYVSLSVLGAKTTDVIEAYAMDDAQLTNQFISYESVRLNANVTKEVNISDAYQVAVPIGVTEIEFKYANGRTVKYVAKEMEYITSEINEICILDETDADSAGILGAGLIKPGARKFFTMGLDGVQSCKVLSGTDVAMYVIKNKIF